MSTSDVMQIDGDRLWASLMSMAEIGATEKGGSRRLALTDEDRQGRDLFIEWCRDAGCGISIDQMGNIFARRPGVTQMRRPWSREVTWTRNPLAVASMGSMAS